MSDQAVTPCKDCANCSPDRSWLFSKAEKMEFARCLADPKQPSPDLLLVDGRTRKRRREYYYCATTRKHSEPTPVCSRFVPLPPKVGIGVWLKQKGLWPW